MRRSLVCLLSVLLVCVASFCLYDFVLADYRLSATAFMALRRVGWAYKKDATLARAEAHGPSLESSLTNSTTSTTAAAQVSMRRNRSVQEVCQCVQTGGIAPKGAAFDATVVTLLVEEMRKRMRVFVYPAQGGCTRGGTNQGGYKIERTLYHRITQSKMRVHNSSSATTFYIPTFITCWRLKKKSRVEGGIRAGKELGKAVEIASRSTPDFRNGTRHFWVSTHDMGKPEPVRVANSSIVNMLVRHGSALLNTADTSWGFSKRMDVSLPCADNIRRANDGLRRVTSSSKPRRFSVFFAGHYEAGYTKGAGLVRVEAVQSILKSVKPVGSAKKAKKSIPAPWDQVRIVKHLPQDEYAQALADSDFCLAPRGSAVWSPRLFEIIWYGCIPVVIADFYHLPFSCFVDWSGIVIRIAQKDAGQVAQVLQDFRKDANRLLKFRERLLRLRDYFIWKKEDGKVDAFEMVMLEVYLKQQRKCVAS
eukprot:TRINITY_DN21276_c0_g1_i1.p1 TRINITY_DN21276_c0_g1~~TRINITY_DN21276_c0_g1_i1.p1  ORF type:complete len:477 (+),score=42.46 TRINITY_DN21276_c0_g1_i1:85-1515(+)